MSKYFVDGIDIATLIGGNGYTGNDRASTPEYPGFPNGWPGDRTIAIAYNFGYRVNGTDVGPDYRGVQVDCNVGQTNIDIANAPYRKFKHIASLIYAGGGGGGGGGGQGWTGGSRNDGGSGGRGGKGGYVWIRDRSITGQRYLFCNIGGGGNGGNSGNDSNTPSSSSRSGNYGNAGNAGGESRLRAYDNGSNNWYDIMGANGGGGGAGGNGGRLSGGGGAGGDGNGFGGGGWGVGENADANTNLYRDGNKDGSPGNGGAGRGTSASFNIGTYGNSGDGGIGWLWFLYAKN
jgi:hypothetical protein